MSRVGEAFEKCKTVLPAGTAQGVIKVVWNVSDSGAPFDVRTFPSPYDATPLPRCLIDAAAGFRFPRPNEGDGTGMMYALTVEARPKDESAPANQQAVFQIVAEHKQQLAACVDALHTTQPKRHGVMELMWRIEPSGAPTDIMVLTPDEEIEPSAVTALGTCLAEALSMWSFPPSASSKEKIRFPIKY